MNTKKLRVDDVQYIVVHGSFTPTKMNIGAADIDRWHREKGWMGIGYHFVIQRNGMIEEGRPLDRPGAHVLDHNHNSIGICLVGGRADNSAEWENNYSMDQLLTLAIHLRQLRRRYKYAKVVGHRDLDDTRECPGFDVSEWIKSGNVFRGM